MPWLNSMKDCRDVLQIMNLHTDLDFLPSAALSDEIMGDAYDAYCDPANGVPGLFDAGFLEKWPVLRVIKQEFNIYGKRN